MNQAHLHLIVNHVPIFGVAFGLAALVWSLLRGSREMLWAAVILFLLSGAFGWIAAETGEGAEEIVKNLPGVTETLIDGHEEAAEAANVSVWLLAAASLAMAVIGRLRRGWLKPVQFLVLVLALVSFGLMARTAQLGGLIRHTEIRSNR